MTNSSSRNKREENSWQFLILWICIALFIRWQVIEPRFIPSGSMLPTLEIQDRLLIEKISPRIKRSLGRDLVYQSIVVFKPPSELIAAGYDPNSALIKRVVGLPGDQIEVHDGILFRNGIAIKEDWLSKPINYEMTNKIVSNHSIWVLGDNRNNSLDSHIWGELPEKNVIGTAVWRYWPIQRFGPIRFPTHREI